MTLAFQAMVMMVLAICGAVAAVPTLLTRPDPKLSPPLRVGLERTGLWIVESPKDLWFVNGLRSSRADLEKLFTRKQSNQMIHYLPSDALSLDHVSRSLRWLRSLAPGAVVLELPPFPPQAR